MTNGLLTRATAYAIFPLKMEFRLFTFPLLFLLIDLREAFNKDAHGNQGGHNENVGKSWGIGGY
jgi:hypothetical protein